MRRVLAVVAVASAAIVMAAPTAGAHPLGNFTVNRYAGVVVSPDAVRVDYVLDLAEIPTFQTLDGIDADGDERTTEAELTAWATARADELAGRVVVEIDGERVPLAAGDARATLSPGQGGLDVLRLEATFAGDHAADEGTVVVRDGNETAAIGWREITLAGAEGFVVVDASVPVTSVSDRLRAYPDDLLSSPLVVSDARGTFAPGSGAGTVPSTDGAQGSDGSTDPLATALSGGGPLVVLGLLLALGLGAWHAILPGHGKTLMAVAMVGSDARIRQAAGVAAAVALMHSASVLALGLAVLALGSTFRPETLYPWLGVVSGGAPLAVGIHLVRTRIRGWRLDRVHAHAHRDGHPHGGHDHGHGLDGAQLLSARGLGAIALAGGILPAPSALLVLLAAIQIHRAAYGVALVVAFSIGLAAALLAIGIGAVRMRGAVLERASSGLATALPLASAAAITAVGAFLTVRAVGSL